MSTRKRTNDWNPWGRSPHSRARARARALLYTFDFRGFLRLLF
nr:MAG TPA: hypothetical protein [Caudoviricetes sp.]DAN30400.1 MAG TPA: hypothetical protein [Caudoviricetes sp.]